jgi:2Fe-2S ferredoxin
LAELIVVTREGERHSLVPTPGHSVMEIIRGAGIDEMIALCGGCCSCATCHVFIDPSCKQPLPKMSEDETELLDSSDHRTDRSRLSCQLPWSDALSGLVVHIAPED